MIAEAAIIRMPVGVPKEGRKVRYKVRPFRPPFVQAANMVPDPTEDMILLAPRDRSQRALLGQLVARGMLLSAPIGTKRGDELRQEAHFSYHASTTPFIMAAQAAWLSQQHPAQPQQPAQLQGPAQPQQSAQLQGPAQPQQSAQPQEAAQPQPEPSTSKATQETGVNEAPPTA
jgi:hypothetical protein